MLRATISVMTMNQYVLRKRKSSQQGRSAIGRLKSGKAAGEDEIRPEILKAFNSEGILWLTRVYHYQVAI